VDATARTPVSARRGPTPADHLAFLLSDVFAAATLHPAHRADLRASGLSDETIRSQEFRSIPPDMLVPLLGRRAADVLHGYVLPFADARRTLEAGRAVWSDHVKAKVFRDEAVEAVRADDVEVQADPWRYNAGRLKYISRRGAPPRLYFPLATLAAVLEGDAALWCVEGEKKSLACSKLGLPSVGLESAWGWHAKGSRELLPDFDVIPLRGRVVELVPDSDVSSNPLIASSMRRLADALRARGAKPRLVRVPGDGARKTGLDDFIATLSEVPA
jgi:hypothetical protein